MSTSRFVGLLRHECSLSWRRPGLWIAFGLLWSFFTYGLLGEAPAGEDKVIAVERVWQAAGQIAFTFNIFYGILVAIFASDRLKRDFDLGLRELQESSPLGNFEQLVAKYCGVLVALLLPAAGYFCVSALLLIATGRAPWELAGTLGLAFLAITVPPAAFVAAFSLVLALAMPLRVYQILFVGYWFWGNYLNPKVMPTLNGTLLTASGLHQFMGYFGGFPGKAAEGPTLDATAATLNLGVLAAAVVGILWLAVLHLDRRSRRV